MNVPPDPRPGHRFSPEAEADPSPEPLAGERFAADLPSHAAATPPSPAIRGEDALTRPRRRRGLLALMVGGLGLGTLELGKTLYAASLGGDWLAAAWGMLGLGALALGGMALVRELWRLRRLRHHDALRQALRTLPEASPQTALGLAERLRVALGLDDDDPHWRGFLAARAPHHDGGEVKALLDHHLLAPRDKAARRLVSRMSSETAIMVAVSPLTLVDMGLVAWRHLAMIDRLCRLYGLELGYASRLRLLRGVLHQMAFAGASELAGEAGMEILSLNLAGRLSARAGQGMAVGLLGARLGLRTQRLARPLVFPAGEAPRVADLRRELWQQLRRLETRDTDTRTR
jgi:putative membrane protein